MKLRTGLVAAAVVVTFAGASHAAQPPLFVAGIAPLTSAERTAMTPSVWRRGCPVPLSALRMVRVTHWNFTAQVRTGRLVVHKDAADDTVAIMRDLYAAKFPIRWMVPIERWKGSDFKSIEADNTSAFNCR